MINYRNIPEHLRSTYILVHSTFPSGIPKKFYMSLLKVLEEELSDRNLAQVMAYFMDRPYGAILNDIYKIPSMSFDINKTNEVRMLLKPYGYDDWLQED